MADEELGAYTPRDAQWILDTVRKLVAKELEHHEGKEAPHNSPPVTPTYFRNDSGETIPPHGCMQCVGTVHVTDDRDYERVDKPADPWFESGAYVWNGEEPVALEDLGTAQVTGRRDIRMLGPAGVAGERYLPKKNSWEIEQDDNGHIVYSGPDLYRTDYNVNRAFHPIPMPPNCIIGTLTTCLKYNENGSIEHEGETIGFQNIWELDTMPGKVKICKHDGVWYLDHRQKYKARFLKVAKGSSGWDKLGHYHGYDPTPCGVDIICELDCTCMEEGDVAYAFYDKLEDQYIVFSSDSAVLGPMDDVPVVWGGDSVGNRPDFHGSCTLTQSLLTLKAKKCGNTPAEYATPIGTTSITVMTDLEQNGICLDKERATIQVCAAVTAATTQICGTECDEESSS